MQHHLLIAEAERDTADRLSVAARDAGFDVTAIDHKADVIRQADVLLPSAVVLAADFDADAGWALCNQLKTHAVLKRVPLVLTLGGDQAEATLGQHRRLRTKADAYQARPYTPADLLEALSPLLAKDRQTYLEELYRIREKAPPPNTLRSALLWLVLLFALILTGLLFFTWDG